MNYNQILKEGENFLKKNDIKNPNLDTELILAKVINKNREEILLNFNNNIYSNCLENEIIIIANLVSIKFLENSDSFSEKEWNEIYKISEDTFVEESDSLMQKGAGAGLTDND